MDKDSMRYRKSLLGLKATLGNKLNHWLLLGSSVWWSWGGSNNWCSYSLGYKFGNCCNCCYNSLGNSFGTRLNR